ncbi:Valine--tRNA ligase [Buchnera aphidicola (Eriosoma grossulariae)]|uniref:valine--tRNA ligase n=1 Tax=Buchnera aphidicola TaxID=9 RepID=UPI0034648D7F
MKTKYQPQYIEEKIYHFWEKNNLFRPNKNIKKNNFCIVIPPPNITGDLHMGHAFQQTIMDIIIRYHRMQGKNTLWQVGTDHAGIATQILVEKKLELEEGKKRIEYTRSEFIEKIWKWKSKFNLSINNQMKKLGNSVDWKNERFTLDKGMSIAVKTAFIQLYKDKLIYQRKKISNWDVQLQTVISDLEVEHRDVNGLVYWIKYFIFSKEKNNLDKNYLLIETTRPETLLGDVALAVHPEDGRYQKYIGLYVLVPIINRLIPIIADTHINQNQGTGCVKITPAHDFHDYKIALIHKLPMINIYTLDGKIREKLQIFDYSGNFSKIYDDSIPVELQQLNLNLARKNIINKLIELNLLKKTISKILTLPYGDRSGKIIEPMLTNQWYLSTSLLAKEAIQAVRDGRIEFIPKKYEKIYFSWMNNIEDWCISRQLWWGHQIPIWFDKNKNVFVGHNEEDVRKNYKISPETILVQETDVLDTWFSSALWTFSSLGWPADTEYFKLFHSTDLLVTGFDIIFFWISRMIMLTMYLIKDDQGNSQVPFKKILITGLIRDEIGQKMSKSKGNVLDPLDMINGINLIELIRKRTKNMIKPELKKIISQRTKLSFPNGIEESGTDALRFTFASLSLLNKNINWDHSRLKSYRNFCNKLWNASRFVIINCQELDLNIFGIDNSTFVFDQWIKIELNETIKNYRIALDNYRFDKAANILYDFVWNKFCDWYLELSKVILRDSNQIQKQKTQYTLLILLEQILRLAHPIIPYITESIWKRLPLFMNNKCNQSIMIQKFPKSYVIPENKKIILEDIVWIQEIICELRNFKINFNLSKKNLLSLFFKNVNIKSKKYLSKYGDFLIKILNLKNFTILNEHDICPIGIKIHIVGLECIIVHHTLLNKNMIKYQFTNIKNKYNYVKKQIQICKKKLSDDNFLTRAPKEIINKEQNKLLELKNKQNKLKNYIQ